MSERSHLKSAGFRRATTLGRLRKKSADYDNFISFKEEIMAQVFENKKLVVIADTDARKVYFRPKNEDVDDAIRWTQMMKEHCQNLIDVTIVYDGIFLPDPEEDETFFYASVEAAKDGKVWVEEAHAFMSPQFKASIEGGCVDLDDLDEEFTEEGGWYSFVIDNIYQDIFGYKPMTGGEGVSIVYDKDVAEMAELNGYDVLPCVKFDKEEGEINYWKIFAKGGEDEYFQKVYSEETPEETSDEDDDKELFTSFAEDQDDFDPDYEGTLHYKNGK